MGGSGAKQSRKARAGSNRWKGEKP